MLQCNWNSNSDRNSNALERSDWRGKISEIKVSKQPSQMLTMEWNMVHMHNGRVCANMSALIIITINIGRLECCKVSTRNQVDVHIAHSWPATRRIEVFERRSPWNQPSTHFSYSGFFSQSKTVRLQSKNGNILTLARKKDTQIVSRYLLRCEWRRKKTAPTKKIMNGIVWCSKYVFVDSFTFFGFFVSLSFRRNNTGRCGIKAQSVKYCLISSAIEQWHWMKYFQWDKL